MCIRACDDNGWMGIIQQKQLFGSGLIRFAWAHNLTDVYGERDSIAGFYSSLSSMHANLNRNLDE